MRTVLVVDDQIDVADIIRVGLESIGYSAVAVGSGARALELFRQRVVAPDIVLTDFMMPSMDGPELVRALRAEGFRGPALLMSAYLEGIAPEQASIFAATLRKPFRITDVADAIGRTV